MSALTAPCVQAVVNRLPAITIVSRTNYTDRTTKTIAAGENVSVRVDGEGKKCRFATPVFIAVQLSPLSVERKSGSFAPCRSKDVIAGIDCQRRDIDICQAIVDQHPVFAIVGGAINAAAFKCAGEDVSAGIDRQRDNGRKFQTVVDRNPSCLHYPSIEKLR